jgi:hypothetical protein
MKLFKFLLSYLLAAVLLFITFFTGLTGIKATSDIMQALCFAICAMSGLGSFWTLIEIAYKLEK